MGGGGEGEEGRAGGKITWGAAVDCSEDQLRVGVEW